MSNQWQTQQRIQSNASSLPINTSLFQHRPFAEPADDEEILALQNHTTDLQAQQDKANNFGHNFGQVQVGESIPAMVPSKLLWMPQDRAESQVDQRAASVNNIAAPASQPVQSKLVSEQSVARTETPILPKSVENSSSRNKRNPILRDGMNMPGGATIETVRGDTNAVIDLLQQKAVEAGGSFGQNANFSRLIDQIDRALSDTSLSDTNIPINFVETRGVNVYWRGYVRFRLGQETPVAGGGEAANRRNYGGTTSSSEEVSYSTTDSAKGTASTGSTSGITTGEPGNGGQTSTGTSTSAGAEVSTSTTRSDKQTDTNTSNRGGTVNMTNTMQRFMAPLIAEVYLAPELDVQGSDYFNPAKWGMYLGEAIEPMRQARGSINCGSVTYYISAGIAAPAAPAQSKGWIEHQLGITEQSKANFVKAAEAHSVDPVQCSNSGSKTLPQNVTSVAEHHHGTSLSGVRLIHGGQADTYCESMSAAAFTSPSADGGSNIFMHSNFSLDSAKGQHTLQHEISHAVQQLRGETSELNGLGGNESRRQELEKSADSHADAILSNSSTLQKLKEQA